MFRIIKKADIVLFVLLLALGFGLSVPSFVRSADKTEPGGIEAIVEIRSGGKTYGSFSLNEDKELIVIQQNGETYIKTIEGSESAEDVLKGIEDGGEKVDHINSVIIEGGKVRMAHASCNNQVCIRQGTISRIRQSIICLPNRVVVEIVPGSEEEAQQGGEPDVISG